MIGDSNTSLYTRISLSKESGMHSVESSSD